MSIFQSIADWAVYSLGLHGRAAESANFFIYDSLKIFSILFFMIMLVGMLRTYLPQHRIKKWLSNRKAGSANFMASLFGAVTPFCTCSSIPIFLSFLRAGVPLGVSFSFLITSPIVNEYLVFLMLPTFGLKVTVLYVMSGLVIGTLGGIILGKMGLEKHLEKDISGNNGLIEEKFRSYKERVRFGISEALGIIKKVWLWIFAGIAIGAIIHGYVPQEAIHAVIDKGGISTVPLAVMLGVPIYASCAAIVPVAVVLFEKGVPLGTALAFMMATAALSLPEAIMLRRAMNLKLIAIFFGTVAIAIMITGYLFNLV
jgi:uncharacterized membrane protein YraQ (UPF0718 family)